MKKIITIIVLIIGVNAAQWFEARPFVISEITENNIIVSDIQTSIIATRIPKDKISWTIPDIEPWVIAMIHCTPDNKIAIENANETQVLIFNTIFEKILTFFVGYDQKFKDKVIETYKKSSSENFVLKALLSNSLPFVEFQSLSYSIQWNKNNIKQLSDYCFKKPNDLTELWRDWFFITTLWRDITQWTKIITRSQRWADESLSMPIISKPSTWSTDEPWHTPKNVSTIRENYIKNFEPIDKPKTVMFSINNIRRPMEYFPADRIIIHHTAGSYKANKQEWIQYMQSLHQYHGKTLGRWDIWYHYLIDGEGNIYEWRRWWMHVVGAHVLGHNRGSIGISMMSDGRYSSKMLVWLLELIVFLWQEYHIDPSGTGIFKNADLSGTETRNTLLAHKEIDKGKPIDPDLPMDVVRKFIGKLANSQTFKNALYTNK